MATAADSALAADGALAIARRRAMWFTDALLFLTAALWGVNYVVVKYGTTVIPPLSFNGVRVALAAAALALVLLARRGERVARRDVLALLALGALGNGFYQVLFAEGIARTRAGNAALVLAAGPAFVALIGRGLRVERVARRGYAGIALSIVGVGLVVFGSATGARTSTAVTGNLLLLAGSAAWALYLVLLVPYARRVSLTAVSAWTMIGGAVPLVAVSMPSIAHTNWAGVTPLTWSAIAYSGLGSLVLAYFFWYRGVRVIGPTRTAIFANLQPVIAVLAAWPMLHEVPTLWQGAGAATIIGGVVLTRT